MTAIIQNSSEESTTTTVSQKGKNSVTSEEGNYRPDETSYSPSDVNRSEISNVATSTSQDSGTTTFLTNTSGRSTNNVGSSGKYLRKFASENSFMLGKNALQSVQVVDNEKSKVDEKKVDDIEFGEAHEISSKNRIFTVRPVTSLPCGPKKNHCGGTVISKLQGRHQESEDGSGSLASEATVTSGAGVYTSATPMSKQKLRFKIRRPKSVTNIGNSTSNNNYDNSFTSQTLYSMDGLDKLEKNGYLNNNEERRMSTVYMMDDDSTHEFEENQTGLLLGKK
uniref:Uncharacterized protein n=1 Tax=Strongyloides papillosus TaxID=174720 RepID=A0A0N5C1G2_STREA